ncbi:aspartate ammonia-lyase [Leisingera sp. ANG-Vp]|uniref:aspartate ammonia-lyase n=1 Tax=Leisingera sp. ANG-Vp TaxID=1577896 RepID=UPI00057CE72F|nr:aspartate ammonia-lyase [Leisingera sp. ANG-Vp]KIC14340.1 aspartate ammonia-lyase [Leisingera sp. ANG-Vp]
MSRTETDGLGQIEVPADALYGSQTRRAQINFPITGVPISHYPEIVRALALVKKACAQTNAELMILDQSKADIIAKVCDEIIAGQHHEHFVVDVIQGGAGTSTNMNANEVIANRALSILGKSSGDYSHFHPNDDVNKSQSTNDVYPTAIRLAVLFTNERLTGAMRRLSAAFDERASCFQAVAKIGRTQLQDAVPMTLGAELAAFAHTIREDVQRVDEAADLLREVNLGGTAIGTRINSPEGYQQRVVANLTEGSGLHLVPADDLIEASSDLGAFVMYSSTLKRIAVKLSKICNDLRLLSSGPRAGLGEILLPPVQAGSSIMPGKVNPVIPEMVNQVCYQAIGNDLIVTMAAEAGQLQLNAMEPVIIHKVLETANTLVAAIQQLSLLCIEGLEADTARCQDLLTGSLALATSLAPHVGYETASKVAKKAQLQGLSVSEAVSQMGLLSDEQVRQVLGLD